MAPNLKNLASRYDRVTSIPANAVPDFDCGFKSGDEVLLPFQGSRRRDAKNTKAVVLSVNPEVKTNLRGLPYQLVEVKDPRGMKSTWASTVLARA